MLHVVPMFHANAWGIPFAALMSGARQVVPGERPIPAQIARIIEAERVTYVGMVPTVAVDLARHALAVGADLSSLRALVLGGSTPCLDLIRMLESDLGVPVFQGWGMTGISPMGTFARPPARTDDDPPARHAFIRTQGRLLPGLEWRLVDEDLRDMPHEGGHPGELLMRALGGQQLLPGRTPRVLSRGVAAHRRHRHHRPEGCLRIVDRTKDLIKSGGEWISSVELEQALLDHPAVQEAAVVSVPHERWQERPLALVALENDSSGPSNLLDHLRRRVPAWWLPEDVLVVAELPRTSVGKIDKKRLRATVPPPVSATGPDPSL